ncbi:retrovirus-related pol polyprotein from transposon TNT 1-94 [Tanacetum coccineum]
MAKTMEQYMSKTRADYGSGIASPKIEDKDSFEPKGHFLKELRDNTFSGSNHEDANKHIEKVFEIVDLFHIPNITQDQEVILFYNGLEVLTRQILDSKGAIPSKTAADAKAQLNSLGREIKKVNEKVYAAQVGCEQCKGPHYTKDYPLKEEGASIKTLEIQIGKMTTVLQERGFGSLPSSTEANSRDHVKSISTTVEADTNPISCMGSSQYAVSTSQNSKLIYEIRQTTILFQIHLNDYYCEEKKGSYGPKFLEANSYEASHINNSIPQKEKDPESFTLPCYINNVCFDNSLADLGASVSVMPLSTYLSLVLGELAHTKLTVELIDRTVKYPKGIAENVLVGIGKFVFPVDFKILDMLEDVKVPLILKRPFLSTAHSKIDVFKRKITLRVGDEKIIFKSVKPANSLIKRVYMLSLRERMELDLESRLMGETLVLNRSLDPLYGDYIELNDLNVPLELRRDQVDDLMPTIEDGEVIRKLKLGMIVIWNELGNRANVPIFIGNFYVLTNFTVVEDMDPYVDEGMGEVVVGKPFCEVLCVETKRFDGMITIHGPNFIRDPFMDKWLTRLYGLPPDMYALVNHQEAAKDILDKVKMLMKGTDLYNQEHECILYNLFDMFAHIPVNTKFLNALPSEWSKFITDVKLAKSLYTTNYDQLYAYLSQHERHANEVRINIQDGRFTIQQVQGRQIQSYAGTGNIGIATTSNGKSFHTNDLDVYDSDCDDLSSAKAVLIANLSSCDPEVLSERIQPTLYDGSVIAKEHAVISVNDDEETLILKEESTSKMLDKQNDPISIEKKIKISPIDYLKLNKIKEDFGKFLIEAPSELPKSQEKDTIIRKLKEIIKSLSRKDNMGNVKKDIDEIETINIELKHSVAKLLSENENLRKEREHLTSIFKDQFDSIGKTHVQSKEHCNSLIDQINAKSVENSDLNAQLQEKVFAITTLKNELRKLKGKNVVNTAVSKPNATVLELIEND